MKRILFCILFSTAAAAQQTVVPSNAPVGRARGEDFGDYNIVNSFETGYRFAEVDGNRGKYRSDVNYRNGLRLFNSNLSIHSKFGLGKYFDEIVLTTQGLGNDPYESAMLRIQKNKLYRYDMLWRLNEYFNPALPIARGYHQMDTERRMQDHDLTLMPQSAVQLKFGYSRIAQDGPALSTVNLFSSRGDEFPLFTDVRRLRSEFRLGGDIRLFGAKLSILRSWENFREDTRDYLNQANPGLNPDDRITLDSFRRDQPYHGNTPLWRGNLLYEKKLFAVNARATYSGGRRNFIFDEYAAGTNRVGFNRQTIVGGNARRPVTTGDFLISLFPTSRLTITNNTSVHSTRIDGDSALRVLENATLSDELVYFRFLGIRTVGNSTDATYRASKWLTLFSGYRFSNRLIRSVENLQFPGDTPFGESHEQENTLHSGMAGVRIKPVKPLTIVLDGELARADRPFTPVSDRNLHALGARAQYKQKSFFLSGAYKQNYNVNSASVSFHSSRSRSYFFDAAWAPKDWLSWEASYAKLHLDTATSLAFFLQSQLIEGRQSIYISNIHTANLGVRFSLARKADLFVGYSISRDAGDGRSTQAAGAGSDPARQVLVPFQTFPLRYESPLARVSFRLRENLRWNAGWQFYRYKEDFHLTFPTQDYRAHTGYTSLSWSF